MLSVLFRMAAALQERSASSEFLLLYCFVSGLCCFLPLFLGCASYLENRPLRDSINDCPEFRYGSAASMALAVPLFIDALLDLRNSGGTALIDVAKTTKQNNYDTVRYNCLNISERILFLMGIVILPVVSLLSLKTENLALIFVCCSKCQINWVGGAVIISLTRYNKDFWSINSSLISLMAFSVGLITSVFVDNTYARTNSPSFDIILLDQVSLVFTIIPSAIFLFNGMRWLLLVHCQAHSWTKHFMTSSIFQDQLTNTGDLLVFNKVRHVFFPTMYVICGITVVALLSLLVGLSHRLENYDRMKLFQCILPFLLFVTGVSTLSMRMVKYEVVQGLYALIDSKKSYVRYISHELRTPLNSAFLGLKLITDSLQNCNSPDDLDRREILADVNVACRTTVDILNDLLCFDKLESGILVAHKHEVPVLSFVTDCVGMFSAQARESGVTIAVVNGSDRNSADNSPVSSERSPCINLLESDTINIDKFKMDQVLRNLISNALKFTPRGGVVTISATFAPGGSDKQRHRSGESSVRSPRDFPIVKLQDSFLKKFSFSARKNTTRIYVGPDLEAGDNVKESVASVHTCQPSVSGHLVIVVRDTGVGMVEEDYTRLFKEIVQFNPEVLQAGGGSGLGLWITKGIVDLHDGNVRVHSDGPGFGTSFTIELPMSRSRIMRSTLSSQLQSPKYSYSAFDDDRDDLSRTNSQELDILTRKLSRRHPVFHLLIVDDSPLNRKMLLKIFRAAGHTCDEAEDGEQAVAKVIEKMALEGEDRVYSAILMDFVMPNMDGPTAVKKIRALGYTARIFGVTGNALDSDVSYFLKSGADVVLAKPLEMSIFIHAMRDSPLSHAPYINQETI